MAEERIKFNVDLNATLEVTKDEYDVHYLEAAQEAEDDGEDIKTATAKKMLHEEAARRLGDELLDGEEWSVGSGRYWITSVDKIEEIERG